MDVVLLSTDGQAFQLQRRAAELCVTLRPVLDDAQAEPFPMHMVASARLSRLVGLLHNIARLPDIAREALHLGRVVAGARMLSTHYNLQTAVELLHDVKLLDCAEAQCLLAVRVAEIMNGKSVDELRSLLQAADDLSAEEKAAALRDSIATREAQDTPVQVEAPSLARSVSLALDAGAVDEGNIIACLARVDGATLRNLKAVSRAWARRARGALADTSTLAWRFNQTNEVRKLLEVMESGLERRPHEPGDSWCPAFPPGSSPFRGARRRRPEGCEHLRLALSVVSGSSRVEPSVLALFKPDLWLELARELATEQEEEEELKLELERWWEERWPQAERERGVPPRPIREPDLPVPQRDGYLRMIMEVLAREPGAYAPSRQHIEDEPLMLALVEQATPAAPVVQALAQALAREPSWPSGTSWPSSSGDV